MNDFNPNGMPTPSFKEKSLSCFLILFFLYHFTNAQKVDTLKIIQWPHSYEAYFDSLQDSYSPPPREPSYKKINLFVRQIDVKKVNNDPLRYIAEGGSKNKIILSFTKFDTTSHKINEKGIDRKVVYGLDGIYPGFFAQWSESTWKGFQYQNLNKVELTYNGKTYIDSIINRAFYFNCPSSDMDIKIYEAIDKRLLILKIAGGDGAGSYNSLLFYKDGQYLTDYKWQYGYGWFVNKFGIDCFDCKDKKGCIYEIKEYL